MKYVYTIVGIGIIGGLLFFWIRTAPKADMPTTPPPGIPVDTIAPEATVPTKAPSSSKKIIQTKNGMKIETTQEGTGEQITNGKTASMLYTGKLEDGTIFDSTAKRNNTPFTFTLGVGQVIRGWDEGVLGMKVGEKRTLTIPADMAYGPSGIPGVIPGGATLIFDVELVSFK